MKRYYVYMLECADDSFYIGVTSDLERRVGQHQFGWDPKCYTHSRRPIRLVYSSDFTEIDQAIRWEKQIQKWSRAKKIALIMGDWSRIHELAKRRGR